jgi:signal transduction histidine kinase
VIPTGEERARRPDRERILAKQSITVELDEETIRCLAVLGKPIEVLAHLAHSAADGVRHPHREQTDESLRVERDKADAAVAKEREVVEGAADEVIRIARQRADQVVHAARDESDRERGPQSTATEGNSERERTRADGLLEDERSNADAVLENERAEQRRYPDDFLVEREATDTNLTGERAHVDTLLVDQREANERMVSATIRAQELSEEADAAKERAEGSERELRAVAEFREMFIGVVGHDLRNPLGSIGIAAAGLLRRGHLDARDAKLATRIIRSSQRMGRMITQLLDLTRARLGHGLPIDPKPTDLREVCQDVVEEFEATTRLEVAGDVTGTWDQDRLAEVLSNLVGNAVEHAAPGTVVLVNAHAAEAQVVVEIENQGDPIPADVLPFIFEPFRRAPQHEKSTTGNLGLGLYIAHQIVLGHGGTLEAHCAEGRTTFVMRLPRVAPAAAAPNPSRPGGDRRRPGSGSADS